MLTVQQIKDTVAEYFKDKPGRDIYLYGSFARGEESEDGDVDLLIEYDDSIAKISFFETLDYRRDLEEIFQCEVDLVEVRLMYPRIRRNIEADKILIYSKERGIPASIEVKRSLSGKKKKDYVVNLEIILSGIEKIVEFTSGVTGVMFIENSLLRNACMAKLNVIGTHAEKLSVEIKEQFTSDEWGAMTEEKKFFDCDVIYEDWGHLWYIVADGLPRLKKKIENIIEVLEKENNAKTN